MKLFKVTYKGVPGFRKSEYIYAHRLEFEGSLAYFRREPQVDYARRLKTVNHVEVDPRDFVHVGDSLYIPQVEYEKFQRMKAIATAAPLVEPAEDEKEVQSVLPHEHRVKLPAGRYDPALGMTRINVSPELFDLLKVNDPGAMSRIKELTQDLGERYIAVCPVMTIPVREEVNHG